MQLNLTSCEIFAEIPIHFCVTHVSLVSLLAQLNWPYLKHLC